MKRKLTVLVNNSININTINNHLKSLILEQKIWFVCVLKTFTCSLWHVIDDSVYQKVVSSLPGVKSLPPFPTGTTTLSYFTTSVFTILLTSVISQPLVRKNHLTDIEKKLYFQE